MCVHMVPPCTGIENGFLEVSDVGRERGSICLLGQIVQRQGVRLDNELARLGSSRLVLAR